MPEQVAFITVELVEREGLFATRSEDLPGLHLIGSNRAAVVRDIVPMIEKLYELNHGIKVKAALAVSPTFDRPATNDGHMQYYAAKVPQQLAA